MGEPEFTTITRELARTCLLAITILNLSLRAIASVAVFTVPDTLVVLPADLFRFAADLLFRRHDARSLHSI
jgi:hypothetical protein